MPPVAPTTVAYEVNTPNAVAVANAAVTVQLVGAGDRVDESTVVTGQLATTTDGTGAFSLALVPNSAYQQAGTYYAVNIAGGPSYSIVVPVSGSPVSLWACRVDPATLEPLAASTPSLYLQRAERSAPNGVAALGADGLVPASQLPSGASTPDATTTTKGIVQLAGDLSGTAAAPTVPGLAAKAPLASPAFTGTPTGITKAHVGLGSVDNTSDASKPISTATQTALDAKAPLASPTFTGTVTAPRVITPPVALVDAATIATDAALGNHFRVTLGGNRTLGNPTNPVDGQKIIWELIQDGTGTRTITLDSAFALGTDITSVVLTTTAGKRDLLGAIYNAGLGKWLVAAFTKGF